MIIKGQVFESDSISLGIAGVVVSDGKSVVSTDQDGYFELKSDEEREFVFISIPKGYEIPSDSQNRAYFYQSIVRGENVQFELERSVDSQQEYMFLHLTDLHLGRGKGMEEFKATVLPEINGYQPAFLTITGDFSFQEGIKQAYLDLLGQFRAPVFNAIGNHEMMIQCLDPKKDYKQLLGPTYYSFNFGEFHYVVLDGCTAAPWRKDWKNVVGFIDETQMGWLKQDLDFIPAGTPTIVFIHIPIVSQNTERFGMEEKEEPAWEIINDQEVITLLSQYNIKFVLQGHIHENAHMYEKGIHFVESGAVCGSWWNGNNKDDSFPGYRVVHISGTSASMYYKPTGKDPELHLFSIESPQFGEPVAETTVCMKVNVFDGDPYNTTVRCRIEGGEWFELKAAHVHIHPHLWEGQLDVTDYPASTVVLEVEVTCPDFGIVRKETSIILKG